MKRLIVLIVVLAIFVTAPVFSQDSGQSEPVDETTLAIETSEADDSAGEESLSVFNAWDFIRMALILAAVVAVIYGIFFVLKRTGNQKFQESRLIKILSSKTLTGNRALHLVEVGNQIFLLGASENTINLVSEIHDKETLDGLRLQSASAESEEKKNFGEILTQVFNRKVDPRRPHVR